MKVLTAFLFCLCTAVISAAQTTTGTLVGTVVDDHGGTISGVSVMATERDTHWFGTATTNNSGNYSIPNLPAGIYTLEIQKTGFKKVVRSDIEVRVNESFRSNATLDVGPLSETVNVQSAPPILQTDTSSLGVTISEEQLQRLLLNGRQYEGLVLLTPGAVSSAPNSHLSNRGGLNVGGIDEHYISSFIDGIDNVDPVIRIASYRPSIDAIEAVKVEENGYNAEFGRNGGAVVNVTTKSGTNLLHGTLWEFLRNDNFDARNYFAPPDFDKPPLIRNQFGAALGGPLKRDRTYFFVVYEGLRQKTGQTHRATVLTEKMRAGDLSEIGLEAIPQSSIHQVSREALQGYPLPNRPGIVGNRIEIANKIEDGDDFSVRLDHRLWEGTRLMGRYSMNRTHVLDPFRTETTGVSNLSGFGQTADRFRTNIALSLTSTLGPSLNNEARAGYNRFRQPQIPVNPGTPSQVPLMGYVKTFLVFNLLGAADTLGSNAEFQRAVNVYNYEDGLSYTKGNHQIKAGVDARRYLFNAYNAPPNTFIFTGARSGHPIADFLLGLPTQSIYFDGAPTGNTRKFEFAAYGQDDWKVTPRLTLNFGLRWEFYGRITERVNKQSFWAPDCNCMQQAGVQASEGLVDNDLNNFAPRLGLAWRPVGDRTVIRLSGGIFYDNDMRHNLEFATNPPFFFTREYNFTSLSDPFPAGQSSSTLRPTTIDKKFRDTYVEQWNLSFQHEITRGLLLETAYVGNHSVKARRLRDVNQSFNGIAPYPGFAQISLFEQAGSSNYHAFQIRAERRFSKSFGFTSAYTWGHAIDDRPGQGGARPQDSYNLRAERGDADFDVRHNWASSASINLPWAADKAWGRWSVNAIAILQGGRPFTVYTNPIFGQRPNLVPGVDWKPADQSPDHWINPAAFQTLPLGAFGNLGRNTLRGPRLNNFDLSIMKTDYIRDARVEFRAEFFNVFNHPNFSIPNSTIGSSLGLISSTASPERQIQFGVKVGF